MGERGGVEICPEFPVHHGEHVEIEPRRHPGAVVVGADQPLGVLHQIGAEQQGVAGLHHRRDRREELRARACGEVADGGAQERHQAPPAGRDLAQMLLEIATYGGDLDARVLIGDRCARSLEHRGVDVERDEPAQRAALTHRVEQPSGLLRGPTAQFHERVRFRRGSDLPCPRGEDLRLGARRVVLRQPGDLIEQITADRVVEPLGRQRFRRSGKPVAHIATQRGLGGVCGQVVLQRERHHDPFNGERSTWWPMTSTRWRSGISCHAGSSS